MSRYVIDAPTLLHIVSDEVQVHAAHTLVAPSLIRSQALTMLLATVRSGEVDERDALRRHTRLTELKMRLLGDRVSRRTAWDLAREHDWDTTYEAEYIAVTTLQADALVALDPSLAAKAAGLVRLVDPAVLALDD